METINTIKGNVVHHGDLNIDGNLTVKGSIKATQDIICLDAEIISENTPELLASIDYVKGLEEKIQQLELELELLKAK